VKLEILVLLGNLEKMAWVGELDPREERGHRENMDCT
jgi:hypothetical protein